MTIADGLRAQLERELPATRRVLEQVPEGKNGWKPHEKSMPLGYLAALVAEMPAWIEMMIGYDAVDILTETGAKFTPVPLGGCRELVERLEACAARGLKALEGATDGHMRKPWKFVVGGHVAQEQPRYVMVTDAVMSHWAHHRGQLTVYLRLLGAKVPAIYGPSADERG